MLQKKATGKGKNGFSYTGQCHIDLNKIHHSCFAPCIKTMPQSHMSFHFLFRNKYI